MFAASSTSGTFGAIEKSTTFKSIGHASSRLKILGTLGTLDMFGTFDMFGTLNMFGTMDVFVKFGTSSKINI